MNDIGELLRPKAVVLLIGERPGLATAESLSAYMAYLPKNGDHDANRNLISNIHSRGVRADEAATRIVNLAEQMMREKISGVSLKEQHIPRSHDKIGTSGHRDIGASEDKTIQPRKNAKSTNQEDLVIE